MNTSKLRCKNCGKEYKACRTNAINLGAFRWKDVACSPECGAAYLEQIIASRRVPTFDKEAFELYEEDYIFDDDCDFEDEEEDDE